jgi:ribonuclease E
MTATAEAAPVSIATQAALPITVAEETPPVADVVADQAPVPAVVHTASQDLGTQSALAPTSLVMAEPDPGTAPTWGTEIRESVVEAEPPVVLTEIVANAGLEWVQTRSDLFGTEGATEHIAPRAPRPVRTRKPKAEVVVEPLQMVETRNDPPLP